MLRLGTIETVGPSAVDEQPVLDAVIEPANAIVDDFGEDWSQADQWYTEGGITEWDSGCQAFDQLDAIFNHGLPTTTVWTSDTGDLVQRVASLDWEASSYVDLVRATPLDCPTITLGQTTVELRSVDATLLTAGDEETEAGSTQQASSHQYGAMELDAFPVADRETDTGNPELLPNRTTWMVVTARHNVVSQLIFAPTDGDGRDQLRSLVATMEAALDRAPIEAEGPIVKPPPPPTVEYQVVTGVELRFNPGTCRNDGGFEHDGISWRLADPVPYEWRDLGPVMGEATMEGTTASFVGPDGTTLTLTTGATTAGCAGWERVPPRPPAQAIGRLNCAPGTLEETRQVDDGRLPEELAADAVPAVVSIEAGEPLHWWGIDQNGTVVVGVLLGDAPDADYQVFTCTNR